MRAVEAEFNRAFNYLLNLIITLEGAHAYPEQAAITMNFDGTQACIFQACHQADGA